MSKCPICKTKYPRKLLGLLADKHCQNIACSEYYVNNMGVNGVEGFPRIRSNKKPKESKDLLPLASSGTPMPKVKVPKLEEANFTGIKLTFDPVYVNPSLPFEEQIKIAMDFYFGNEYEELKIGRNYSNGQGYVEVNTHYLFMDHFTIFAKFYIKENMWTLLEWRKTQ